MTKTIKQLSVTALTSLILFNSALAMAANYSDVSSSYWAYSPINTLTDEKVIAGYPDNTFKPEGKVARGEFSGMLVRALNQQSLSVLGDLPYTDMKKDMGSYNDVNKINNLELVVGYPDKTFKPDAYITKTEAMIVLANTLSGRNLSVQEAEEVLSIFVDNQTIKKWAKGTVSKSVVYDVYVKHPNPKVLSANNYATRAEVADLLYKVRTSSALLAQYRSANTVEVAVEKPETTSLQHLKMPSDASSNEVLVRRLSAKVTGGNAIETAFISDFSSKGIAANAPIQLVLKEDLYTQEGTFLLPAGSLFEGTVSSYEKARLRNKNAKVSFDIDKLTLPSGRTYKISAETGFIGSGYNTNNFKRDAIIALTTTAVGTGIGALAGLNDECAEGAAIGAYSTAGVGVLAAAIAPGFEIKRKAGDKVFIKLLQDLQLDR